MKITKFGIVSQDQDGDIELKDFHFDTEGAREIDAAQCVYAVVDVLFSHVKDGIRMGNNLNTPPIIAPPVAAGSVDTLQRFELVESQHGTGYMVHWDKAMEEDSDGEWVKHSDVNAWAAQHVANAIKDQMERAEKAEAEVKQVNEWRAAALVSNQQLYELMEAKLAKAEARAAHLEHFFKHYSVQVPPQYTAMHTMEDSSANKK